VYVTDDILLNGGLDSPQLPFRRGTSSQLAGQARLDKLGETAGSVPAIPTADQELEKAEAKGDYKTTLEIKSRQFGTMLGGSR
jgi:hypothetical protein